MYLKHYKAKRVSYPSSTIQRPMLTTYIKTLAELLLLLVYYSETEVNFIGLFKLRRHAHDLREGFFGVVQGSIAVVQNTNTVPELGFL